MVEQLKFIVEQLKRPPFNRKDYNILTFDNLTNNQLLQVLTDVFAAIDPYDPFVRKPLFPQDTRPIFRLIFSIKLIFVMKNRKKQLRDT
jgi:hypothetical protein